MLQILKAYGIPNQLVEGDTLAPYLFVAVLDYALREAVEGKEEQLGFQLEKRRSRRIGPDVQTDLDFDVALLPAEIHQAQELLQRVESSVGKVGLKINASKTKFKSFNHSQQIPIQTNNGTKLEEVRDWVSGWLARKKM
ncbi:uncharacterized protein [Amphiura filiformis]|uniref:uncharacterized protein n=1 Tax=Amphiura filiformis TaxID=82378 RepID=UPI003B2125B0